MIEIYISKILTGFFQTIYGIKCTHFPENLWLAMSTRSIMKTNINLITREEILK